MPMQPFDEAGLAEIATGRRHSLFAADVRQRHDQLSEAISDRRLLVTGGGGSIGSSTIRHILRFRPAALHIVDIAENALAELARDFRSDAEVRLPPDTRFLPIDFGGGSTQRLLRAEPAYDAVLHFAAHKHVRSEKDVPSLLQMIDTNVVKLGKFLVWLDQFGHGGRRFAVSTDKAANPTSFMGASKRLMEHVLFAHPAKVTTCARFANVAFSNGSLPQAFLYRLARRQPLAAPEGVRRYFVSLEEAGEICLLTAFAASDGAILIPELDAQANSRPLLDIAAGVLAHQGLQPAYYNDDIAARAAVAGDLSLGRYPVLVTPLDTSGEKPFEEFIADGEEAEDAGLSSLKMVRHRAMPNALGPLLDFLRQLIERPDVAVTKAEIALRIKQVAIGFDHVEAGGRSLDERP